MRQRELREVGAPDRPAGRLAEFRGRLDALPHDDTDQPLRLTDAEWAEHVTEVRERLADGLATDRLFTTDPDREHWTPERSRQHARIVDFFLTGHADVPRDRQAIIAGGLPGAGKTTILRDHAGIDLSQYMVINPDDIKVELARRGLMPEVDGLSPMEASDLAHEECSAIAKQLARKAIGLGMNVVWDITLSSAASATQRIDALRQAGYERIEGVFVDIPPEVSVRRADARHRADHENYRCGMGLGGRYIAPEAILAQTDSEWGSQNRRNFEQVKQRFDGYRLYDNSVDGRAPSLVDREVS